MVPDRSAPKVNVEVSVTVLHAHQTILLYLRPWQWARHREQQVRMTTATAAATKWQQQQHNTITTTTRIMLCRPVSNFQIYIFSLKDSMTMKRGSLLFNKLQIAWFQFFGKIGHFLPQTEGHNKLLNPSNHWQSMHSMGILFPFLSLTPSPLSSLLCPSPSHSSLPAHLSSGSVSGQCLSIQSSFLTTLGGDTSFESLGGGIKQQQTLRLAQGEEREASSVCCAYKFSGQQFPCHHARN